MKTKFRVLRLIQDNNLNPPHSLRDTITLGEPFGETDTREEAMQLIEEQGHVFAEYIIVEVFET